MRYLGEQLTRRIKKSGTRRLKEYVKSRINPLQRILDYNLDKASKLGIYWYEISNLLFKVYSDWKLSWLSDDQIDQPFAKILRKKSSIPKYSTTEEVLTLINIKP